VWTSWSGFPYWNEHFLGHTWACPIMAPVDILNLICKGGSDAASGYQYCSNLSIIIVALGGSVAEWLACWTQAQKGSGSNRSHDAVG